MKRFFLLCLLFASVFLSCRKEEVNEELSGIWKMVLVTDNATGVASTKPSSVNGDVIITFNTASATAGIFSGHTTINDFEGNFTTGESDSLSVDYFSMTKMGETLWGNEFIDNFRIAQGYFFINIGKLSVKSADNTLTFQRE